MIGNLLGNRYEIIEQLGGGGMALVYKGQDTILNRLVTIKVLRSEYTSDEEFVKRFRSEAQAVASLSHPNIVSIYDVGRAEKVDYLVMEYVEGDNLKTVIKQHGPLLPAKAAQIAMQVGEALEHAHANQIVHRDVKPQNILITRDGRAKLTDFGIALGATASTIAKSEGVMGSVHYVSPEQARGEKTGPHSDIYSLGVVLYEMAANALPFQGETPVGVALKHIQEEPVLPSQINPAISLRMENVIMRAMAKNPARRYETARQMVQELAGIAGIGEELWSAGAEKDEFTTRLIPTLKVGSAGEETPVVVEQSSAGRKKAAVWRWAAGLTLLALFIAGGVYYQLFYSIKEVDMPSLTGLTEGEAKNKLAELNMTNYEIEAVYDTDATLGQVLRQNPSAYSRVKITRQVVLFLSQGAERVEMPAVVGWKIDQARNELRASGFGLGELSYAYSDQYDPDIVMEQFPKSSENVLKGESVALTVSKGKEVVILQMPELTGKTLAEARKVLEQNKLLADDGNLTRTGSTVYDKDLVINQLPAAYSEVKEGDRVRLTVSDGPGPTPYTAQVTVQLRDGRYHHLRIEVSDQKGSRNAYDEDLNQTGPGQSVGRTVTYYGRATIKAYLDDNLEGIGEFEGGRSVS